MVRQAGRDAIRDYLKNRDDWPLDDYFSGAHAGDEYTLLSTIATENIAFMEADDDIHYTLIGLSVLETYGPDFVWRDVARTWNFSIPITIFVRRKRKPS